MPNSIIHGAGACACCTDLLQAKLDRRRFMALAGGSVLSTAVPFWASAAEGDFEAMVLSCIDPRFPELVRDYTRRIGLTGKYSQFVIAGAAIGVVVVSSHPM